MHLLQMFGQQPFGTICDNASANFTFRFRPNFVHSLSFWAMLGGQGGADGWEAWLISSSGPKPRNIKKNHYFVIKKILKPYTEKVQKIECKYCKT
jgi:hypothetical protein